MFTQTVNRRCPRLVLACLALAGLFFSASVRAAPEKELRILATTFPVWLFTRNVVHDCPHVRTELLIPTNFGCPHDYALTPRDMQKLSRATALVINGLEMENFLTVPLAASNGGPTIIDAGAGIAAPPQPASPHHITAAGFNQHSHGGMNPHIFSGPKQAAIMTRAIAEGLARIDPANADVYRAAAGAYIARLTALGERLAALGAVAPRKGIVLQHDSLFWLAANAGLEILAVMQTNEDAPPSANELLRLTALVRRERPALIAADPQYADRLVRTLAQETNVPAASLDPVSSGPENAPLDWYETVMSANCQTLERYFDPR